jgi:hypothetical protein
MYAPTFTALCIASMSSCSWNCEHEGGSVALRSLGGCGVAKLGDGWVACVKAGVAREASGFGYQWVHAQRQHMPRRQGSDLLQRKLQQLHHAASDLEHAVLALRNLHHALRLGRVQLGHLLLSQGRVLTHAKGSNRSGGARRVLAGSCDVSSSCGVSGSCDMRSLGMRSLGSVPIMAPWG